jgi:hypothetical protein
MGTRTALTVFTSISTSPQRQKDDEHLFPDINVCRRLDSSLGHTVLRKATHTNLYYHPTYKHSVLSNFSHRARDICDHAELDSLEETCRQTVTTAAISVISSILLRK